MLYGWDQVRAELIPHQLTRSDGQTLDAWRTIGAGTATRNIFIAMPVETPPEVARLLFAPEAAAAPRETPPVAAGLPPQMTITEGFALLDASVEDLLTATVEEIVSLIDARAPPACGPPCSRARSSSAAGRGPATGTRPRACSMSCCSPPRACPAT